MRAPAFVAALVAGVLAALLMGCGVDTKDSGTPKAETTKTTETTTVDPQATSRLPKRADGIVAVEGPAQGSLTPQVTGVADIRVNYAGQGESDGFRDLCTGDIDVLDTSRRISAAEQRLCRRNGVDLAQPIQVASDAVVIATPNEHDVGGDCLRISTVNDIFRAGSGLTNWNQVGFFNVPMHVTGGPADSAAFQFFAQLVLGVDGGATLDDIRSDYILRGTEDGVRREVTSAARIEQVRDRFVDRLRRARTARDLEFQLEVDRAIREAKERMLDIFDRETARIRANQTTLTTAQKEQISRENLRRITRAQRLAQERAVARFSYPRLARLRARYQAALQRERRLGTIGVFRFSYYELYEQQLRPMEIWDPERAAASLDDMTGVDVADPRTATTTTPTTATTGTGTTTTQTTATTATTPTVEQEEDGDVTVDAAQTPWCVFPSQQTITNGSYPLSRPLLLYVSKLNLRRDEVQSFLRAYLDRAQALARRNRLVPVPEAVQTANQAIIELDDTPGAIDPADQTTTTATTPATTTPEGQLPGVGEGSTTLTTTTTTGTTTGTTTTAP
ncbi:MAG: substrate-binding domain-containing protein [Solirubrobacteraceae bacterium]